MAPKSDDGLAALVIEMGGKGKKKPKPSYDEETDVEDEEEVDMAKEAKSMAMESFMSAVTGGNTDEALDAFQDLLDACQG